MAHAAEDGRSDPLPTTGKKSDDRPEAAYAVRGLSRSARSLLALACGATILEATLFTALAPLIPYYSSRFALATSAAGILNGCYAAAVVLFALPIAILLGRSSAKPIALGGLALMSGSCLAFGFAGSFSILVIARVAQGIAAACIWESVTVWVLSQTPDGRRNEIVGTVIGVGIVGSIIGPPLGALAAQIGPRAGFALVAAAAAALLLAAARSFGGETSHRSLDPTSALSKLRSPDLLIGGWFTLLPALLLGLVGVLGPLRLDALGASSAAIAAAFLASACLEAALSPWLGRVCDRQGPAPLLRVCLIAIAIASIALAFSDSAPALGVVIAMVGVVLGLAWTPANAMLSIKATGLGVQQEMVFAVWLLGWAVGQAVGSAGGSAIAQAVSIRAPYLMLMTLALVTLLAAGQWLARAGFARSRPS